MSDDRTCTHASCDRPLLQRGLCSIHYSRQRDGRPMDAPIKPKGRQVCTVDGCDGLVHGDALCMFHYQRRRNGTLLTAPSRRGKTFPERLAQFVPTLPDDACWEWTGARDTNQYGRFRAPGQTSLAHRLVYEQLVGPIPDGLTLDHLCFNPPCVNPTHLEPVTNEENARRGALRRWQNERKAP